MISQLFYSTNSDKETLHSRITPTDEQQEFQQESWHDLADFLTSEIRDETDLSPSTRLQGSYKLKTQIRPVDDGEFDVDVGIYFEWSGGSCSGPLEPKQLKGLVQDVLDNYSQNCDRVVELVSPPKERCSRVIFDENFHVDIPSYHQGSDASKMYLATETNGWEKSNPEALHEWFQDKLPEDKRTIARRMIRYIKAWSHLNIKDDNDRISSVALTVLVAQIFERVDHERYDGEDNKVLESVLAELVNELSQDQEVANPINQEEDLNSRLSQYQFEKFRKKLSEFHQQARYANSSNDSLYSLWVWQNLFHQLLPLPLKKDLNEQNSFDKLDFVPEVQVEAVSKDDPEDVQEDRNNRIGPVSGGLNLRFNVSNTKNIPDSAEFSWVARNRGGVAERFNDLGHVVELNEAGSHKIKDRTAYKGTHHMDLMVVNNQAVIGFRRIPVKITDTLSDRSPSYPNS